MTHPKVETLPANADIQTIMSVIERDGAVILKDVLSSEQLQSLRDEISPYINATEDGRDDFTGRHTTRTGALVARSAMCRDMVMNETVLAAADDFLLPNCQRYQLHLRSFPDRRTGRMTVSQRRTKSAMRRCLQDPS